VYVSLCNFELYIITNLQFKVVGESVGYTTKFNMMQIITNFAVKIIILPNNYSLCMERNTSLRVCVQIGRFALLGVYFTILLYIINVYQIIIQLNKNKHSYILVFLCGLDWCR